MNKLRTEFEKSDLCKAMVGTGTDANWNLKRHPVGGEYSDQYLWSRLEAAWQGFQSGHAAGLERAAGICSDATDEYDADCENGRALAATRCMNDIIRATENIRLAKRVAELDPSNCHPMRLNAAGLADGGST